MTGVWMTHSFEIVAVSRPEVMPTTSLTPTTVVLVSVRLPLVDPQAPPTPHARYSLPSFSP